MKKFLIIPILCILGLTNVNATNVYYTNGEVNLTKKEYDFVKEFYGETFLEDMTSDDYSWIEELDVNNNVVAVKSVNLEPMGILPYGTNVTSNSKTLSIAKSCYTNYCIVTTNVNFLNNPSVRSYDVMGARFSGTSLYNQNITTQVRSSSGTTVSSNYQYFNNGFGNSVKLPDNGSNIIIQQKFYVNPTGTVYASYQHAIKSVSLSTSKMYFISMTGYGGVFTFTGSAINSYDATTGVDISL